eukprot:PLAT13601.1.p1 GENE.PLAT13601.1~~PLAT13601.1.p1  ORF type:complete len:128 (-),score=42.54 PLAT13601.1:159-542(-)
MSLARSLASSVLRTVPARAGASALTAARSITTETRPDGVVVLKTDEQYDAHHEDGLKLWGQVSYGGMAISLLFAGIVFVAADHHGHNEARPYFRVRHKAFPWDCSDCGLFEVECLEKCSAAKRGLSA